MSTFPMPRRSATETYRARRNVGIVAMAVLLLVSAAAVAGVFDEVAKLTASDAAAGDAFGFRVAISGDTIVVGAPGNEAAYVYEPDGAGGFSEIAQLTASDAVAGHFFGNKLAFAGDAIVVGAEGDGHAGFLSGSAYVFKSDGAGGFGEVAKLTASDAAVFDRFGSSIAISGGTIVVGATSDDHAAGGNAGSAYVFKPDGVGGYDEVAKLTASDAAADDLFGIVAISGGTIVVGAPRNDDAGSSSGSAYVFEPDGVGGYDEVAKLTASDAAADDLFGVVAISGGTIVVGAHGNDDAGSSSGSAYVFDGSAEQQLASLIGTIEDLNGNGTLNRGQANSLITKLEGALERLDEGNVGVAVSRIAAFIHQVEAYVAGGVLTDVQGDELIAAANSIIDAMLAE